MPKNGSFPSKEAELNLYFQTAATYVLANAARLLVSPANKIGLNTEIAAWNSIFPQVQNSNTCTKTIILNKVDAKENLIVRLRAIYADVPESVWTTEDRVTSNYSPKNG